MSQKKQKRKRQLQRWLDSLGLGSLAILVEKYPTLRVNKQFSRIETPSSHFYIKHWAPISPGQTVTKGRVKCKLMHGDGWTVIVPDQIFINVNPDWKWIQPLGFGANFCINTEVDSACRLRVDISAGECVNVRFMGGPPIKCYEDGSHLYACEIFGPSDLLAHVTGDAQFDAQEVPYLRLYHHTMASIRPKILSSGHFRTSDCNIQGTTKRMFNVAYAYFTPLHTIRTNEDLRKIAMSEDAKLYLRRDGCTLQEPLLPGEAEQHPDDVLILDVYPSSPQKREVAIPVWIDATVLAPQHIYRHSPQGDPVYYEITHEFIHRVGVMPGSTVSFDSQIRIRRHRDMKQFDYIVVGDCISIDGLAAPYDEEDTRHILKIERVNEGRSFVEFWFTNSNKDLFTGKNPEMQKFL